MLFSKYLQTKSKPNKGFVFVLEAAIALVLFLMILSAVSLHTNSGKNSLQNQNSQDTLSSALSFLDENGYVFYVTDQNISADSKITQIHSKIASLLPNNYYIRTELNDYEADLNKCKLNPTFNNCFTDLNSYSPQGPTIPTEKDIIHQRIILAKKSSAKECSIGAIFSPFTGINQPATEPKINKLFFSSENTSQKVNKLFFAGYSDKNDLNVSFNVSVTPTDEVECGQTIRADLNATISAPGRYPAAIMLVQDKSGSMAWDGLLDLTDPRDLFTLGNYVFVADGSAGLRDINISNPLSANILGTYNSPGTASGVHVISNTAYLADGTSGLNVINVTNKAAPATLGSITTIGTADKVFTSGNYAYVVTTSNGSTNISDFNISGSQNFDLNVGKLTQDLNIGVTGADNNNFNIGVTGANYAISQSFVAASNTIRTVSVLVRKTSSTNPPANLTVDLRTALPGSGSTLATGTITAASLSTTKGWTSVDFGSDIAVTLGQTYYLVLSTSGTHASRYYQWYSRTSTPSIYTNGLSYITSSPQNNTDAFLQTNTTISQAAQSFIPNSNSIRLISLYLRRNPAGAAPPNNLTVNLRQTISGANIATGTITPASTTNSYAWVDADFGSNIDVDPTATYYLVISTTGSNSANYYQWAALNTNPYANGTAYSMTTSQTNIDAFIRTNHRARTGLQIIDISNPAALVHKSSFAGTDPNDIFVFDNYAYFSDGTAGLRILDITSPINPTQLGIIDTTNAQGLSISGNYAYVADGSAGLRVIDITNKSAPSILGTYNTPGTAYDAYYYSDGNVYVADDSSLLGVNVSTPSSPSLVRTFSTPYNYQRVQITNNYALLTPGYNSSLVSFSILNGPKIDQSKVSASSFIDNNGWKTVDKIGIVSFSSSTTTDQTLLKLEDTNKTILKNKMNALVANGSTAIGDAIYSATTELSSIRVSPGEYKFQVLLSDGQSNSGSNPVTAATDANSKGIKIYTIGFGSDADEATLQQIATITDANYYKANDITALQGIYALIATDIGEYLSMASSKAYDSNIIIPIDQCSFITNDGNGTCRAIGDSNYLVYNVSLIDPTHPWIDFYEMTIPCDNPAACRSSQLILPGSGTSFNWTDSNHSQRDPFVWDTNKTINFKYKDLGVTLSNAFINEDNQISLDVNAYNSGSLSTPTSTVDFYLDDPNTGTFLKQETVPALNPSQYNLYLGEEFTTQGWIYAIINKSKAILECPGNNIASIYCTGAPRTQYYVLDVWMWRK